MLSIGLEILDSYYTPKQYLTLSIPGSRVSVPNYFYYGIQIEIQRIDDRLPRQ